MKTLTAELIAWLDQQVITSENIGSIRRRLMMPWSSQWNAVVRDETGIRENAGRASKRLADYITHYGGRPPCDIEGVPGSWPMGNLWTTRWDEVTCPKCLEKQNPKPETLHE